MIFQCPLSLDAIPTRILQSVGRWLQNLMLFSLTFLLVCFFYWLEIYHCLSPSACDSAPFFTQSLLNLLFFPAPISSSSPQSLKEFSCFSQPLDHFCCPDSFRFEQFYIFSPFWTRKPHINKPLLLSQAQPSSSRRKKSRKCRMAAWRRSTEEGIYVMSLSQHLELKFDIWLEVWETLVNISLSVVLWKAGCCFARTCLISSPVLVIFWSWSVL